MSGINLKSKGILESLKMFEEDRKVDAKYVFEVLEEAIIKTYQKHISAPDAVVRVVFSPNEMKVYHDLIVVDDDSDTFDETLDILYSDAKEIKNDVNIGDVISREVDFAEIGRTSIGVAKNILKQRSKEFDKQRIYNEFKGKEYELISGVVKTVEKNFVLVDIKNTIGILTHNEQIPGEIYREGQAIRCIIKEVNKETKGSQVILSRADEKFVERIFEKEVPEIAQGIVEIKAVARDAGERTKMAVYSHNEDVDAIGACIGPRGTRVQAVISEIGHNEKIDIFEWKDNLRDLIKNVLAPAEIKAVYYADDNNEHRYNRDLVVVVDDDQLSVAIGKRGKNVRLAVKLTGRKIDIKTLSQVLEDGIDIKARENEFIADRDRIAEEKKQKEMLAQQEEIRRRQELFENEVAKNDTGYSEEALEEMEVKPLPEEETTYVDIVEEETKPEVKEEVKENENTEEESEEVMETKEEEKKPSRKKAELTPKTGYVSKLEKFAEVSNKPAEVAPKKRRKKKDDEDRRLRSEDLEMGKDYEFQPEYTEEELEEIALAQEEEENDTWINDDIDFDEYDEYYDEEEDRR